MPNNIQTIIDKYDDIFGEKHHQICVGKNCECHKEVKQFLKDSLTSMLDGTQEKIVSLVNDIGEAHNISTEYWEREVINIINSHK